MKYLPYVIGALIIFGLLVKLIPEAGRRVRRGSFGRKRLATPREQTMFWRLLEAFPGPEHIVLTQVSFGALLVAKNGAIRPNHCWKRPHRSLCTLAGAEPGAANGPGTCD